jgi:glycosyltransferase involved in cell wall biosynthesis
VFGLYSVWLPKALAACGRAMRDHRPDAVLTTGPPHLVHLLGLYLRHRHGLPWVADFRDPWITKEEGTPTCGNMGHAGSFRRRWLTRLERVVIENADAIASTGPLATRKLCESFPGRRTRMVTLTNGYDPENFDQGDAIVPTGEAVRIVHAGEIYAGRDPRPLLDAIRDLGSGPDAGLPPVQVRFLGRIPDGLDFADEVRRRGLEGIVENPGHVPYAQSLREMSQADVLLLLDSPRRRVGVPAKLYEYIGAGRAILALGEPDGDLAWALRASGIPHRIAPPNDPAAIRQGLVGLIREIKDGRDIAGDVRGRQVFTREAVARRLVSILESVTAPAEAGPVPAAEDLACSASAPVPQSEPLRIP